jgi:hypothetical protein
VHEAGVRQDVPVERGTILDGDQLETALLGSVFSDRFHAHF